MQSATDAGAKELAMIGKTFASLEMLKLRIRMRPAPKPIDTTKIVKRQGRGVEQSFTET